MTKLTVTWLIDQGQGGGIAIEDAGSLCALLPRGTSKKDVPERLKLYEQLRDERAHKVQHLTRLAGADLTDANRGEFNSEYLCDTSSLKYTKPSQSWSSPTTIMGTTSGITHLLRSRITFGPAQVPYINVCLYPGDRCPALAKII